MYKEEIEISKDEGTKLLKLPEWIILGENTFGYVYWNSKTGEIMSDGLGKINAYCYFIRRKV